MNNDIPRHKIYSLAVQTFRRPDGTYEHQVEKNGADEFFTILASDADLRIYKTRQIKEIEDERAKGKDVTTARMILTNESYLG